MAEALKLMLTGMGTVFFILIMVVVLGNVIIKVTNSFASEASASVTTSVATSEIGASKLAAIVSAVDVVTKGKGKVTTIEKMK